MQSWEPPAGLSHRSWVVCCGAARETGTLCFLEPFVVASGRRLERTRGRAMVSFSLCLGSPACAGAEGLEGCGLQ